MGAHLDRLKTALADRYAIEEEIGSGNSIINYLLYLFYGNRSCI